MKKPLRVLNVEDSERDAALLSRHLTRAGFELVSDRVDTAESMKAALASSAWDVILCDYAMPQFDALAALTLVKDASLEIPFIIISGTVGEAVAVEAMRAGAHDYLMKDNLARLGPTIERELLESENRRARQRAEEELRFQKSLLESQSEASVDGILVVSKAGEILSFNQRFLEVWSVSEEVLRERSDQVALDHVLDKLATPGEFLARINHLYQHPEEGSHDEIQLKDGRTLDRYSAPIKSADGEYYGRIWFFRDITERKRAEEVLRESEANFKELFEDAPVAYHELDQEGRISRVNLTEQRLLGYSAEEMQGRFAWEFIVEEVSQQATALKLSGKGTLEPFERTLIRKDGTLVPMEVEDRLLYDVDGNIYGIRSTLHDITGRKRAEAALRESEGRSRLFVEHAPAALAMFDREMRYLIASRRWLSEYGLNGRDVVGLSHYEVFPEISADWKAVHRRALAGEIVRAESDRFQRGDGSVQWLRWEVRPWFDAAGAVGGIAIFSEDITERKLAEDALRESEQRYRSLFENMIEGYAYCRMLFDHDTPCDFIYLEVNDKFEQLTGLKDVVGKKVSEVIPGFQETSAELLGVYGRVALTGKAERLETYLEPLGIWFSISVYSPAKEHFIAIFDNITERKQAELALRERLDLQEQLAQIAATSPGVLYSFRLLPDGSRCFPYASPAVEDLFGLRASDMARDGSEVFARMHSEDIDQVQASIAESARTFLPWSNEFRFVHPDRGEIWIMASSVPQREPDGSILWRGFGMDITERKRSEADAMRLATAVEQTADSVVITGPEGNIQYVNPAFERITGYAKEEVLDKNPRLLKSGKTEPAVYKELWETITRGEVWVGQLTNRKKDGTLFEERVTISPVHDKTDRIVNYIAVKQDISDLIDLEDQLRQSQKMEAIGQLAGGVAHDFNNLLTAINGYSSLALQRIEGNPLVRNYLEEIRKAGDRAANLTRQLLAFGRKQILQPLPINLNDVITDMNKMLRRLIGEDVELSAILDRAVKKIKADPGQIEQVLVNLVVNARDAMPQGGKLTIETMGIDLDEEYANRHIGVGPGRYVMLAVSDTGTGMDEDTRARIFDPFFTTKEKGKGTGLGLSTVYGIVKQSGGNIWVYSELGHGTTFKVYLPELTTAPQETDAVTVELPVPGGSETILLVEDEDVVRGLASKILENVGYHVLEASRGDEAIRLCGQLAEPIDLLLTDVVMPETSGKEVADQLTALKPDLKVLFMSGYTDEAIVHHGVLDSDIEFIQKPFTPAGLARKVREVLDANGASPKR